MLARQVAAELGRDLVLQVHGGGAGGGHLPDRAGGVVPAGVDIDQQRQINPLRDPARIGQDVGKLGFAGVGPAVRVVGHAGAGEVERPEPGALGEECRIGVDGPGDLERFFGGEGGAESLAGGRGHREESVQQARSGLARCRGGGGLV
jgi:hypothetical protein